MCVRCRFEQEATNPVVYRHELVRSQKGQLEQIPDDVIFDPALHRNYETRCPKCGGSGAVYIQPKAHTTDDKIKIVNCCINVNCVHKWGSG